MIKVKNLLLLIIVRSKAERNPKHMVIFPLVEGWLHTSA